MLLMVISGTYQIF